MSNIKVKLLNLHGGDSDVAQAAWVSSGRGNANNPERVKKLIEMLIKEDHRTPFERITAEFELYVPQRIGVQVLRHRMASHSVASARYGHTFDDVFQTMSTAIQEGIRDAHVLVNLAEIDLLQEEMVDKYNEILEQFKDHPQKKRIRELAAMLLPQGTMVHQHVMMNFNSLRHFISLRLAARAQKEIQFIAAEMLRLVSEQAQVKHSVKFLTRGKLDDFTNKVSK